MFTRYIIFLCAGYLFYFAACIIWDSFWGKNKNTDNKETVSYNFLTEEVDESVNVDEQDYTLSDEKKKIIEMPNINYVQVEHQGFNVDENLLASLKSEASSYLREIGLK